MTPPRKLTLDFRPNTLYHGDCMDILKGWDDGCVDLIYLDPPFNSDADYNILYGKDRAGEARDEPAQFTAFKDTWYWNENAATRVAEISRAVGHPAQKAIRGLAEMLPETGMLAYLVYMADRLAEMRRVLKDNGSIYLHCNSTASHYLKTIMDCVFGGKNFRNEIMWHHPKIGVAKNKFTANTDTLFFYTKTDEYRFDVQYGDEPNELYNRWKSKLRGNALYFAEAKNIKDSPAQSKIRVREKELGRELRDSDIVVDFSLPENHKVMDNVWKISFLKGNSKESLGYPTQKPKKLLKRVIKASSNKGDIVLDPFCGCGTTLEAAYKLDRKLIGIDISPYAITRVCHDRLKNAEDISIQGLPTDINGAREMAERADRGRFMFEQWAVTTLPGFEPNDKQTGDGGIDGRGGLLYPPEGEKGLCVVQVKSGNFSPDHMRALLSKVTGGSASLVIFVTMEKMRDTQTARKCVAEAGRFQEGAKTFNRMMFWSIEEYFAGEKLQLPAMAHPRTGKMLQEVMSPD